VIAGANRRCSSLGFTMREQLTEKGHIDGIFASPGVGNLVEPFGTVTAESFDATSYVNARGTLFFVQKALAFLRHHASIILNGAARSGGRGFPTITVCAQQSSSPFIPAYSALQDRKIRVNLLNPGGIATPAQDFLPPGAQEVYAEDGSLREARVVTIPGVNHLTSCVGRRFRNDGHSLPVL
jgi:NAD(P)-dependent dehydrogenase (short-subunit alcohol dehydrogenase family)